MKIISDQEHAQIGESGAEQFLIRTFRYRSLVPPASLPNQIIYMIIDGRSLSNAAILHAQVCIVGGGPAGITIAHELRSLGCKVILIESGDSSPKREADELNIGAEASSGFPPTSLFRRRGLGGASLIWGGRCVPFDPIDFERRPHIPLSGWPISFDEVNKYYPRAMAYLEAGAAEFNATDALRSAPPFIEGFDSDDVLTDSFERFSPPTNFWGKYGPALRSSDAVVVLTNTTCTHLTSLPCGKVVSAVCATSPDNHVEVAATHFVVAGGGFESFRVLANSITPAGHSLGDQGGMLGRCLMGHVEGTVGKLVLDRPDRHVQWGFERSRDGVYGRRRLSISAVAQRAHGTMNFVARLHHEQVADPQHNNPVLSAMFLVKNLLLPEYRRKIAVIDQAAAARFSKGSLFWYSHLKNIAFGAPTLAKFSAAWFWRRHLIYRRIPHVVLKSASGSYPLDINGEESPNPANRLYLTDNRDRFGTRQFGVKWKPNDIDLASIAKSCQIIRDAFAKSGVARYVFSDSTLQDDIRNCVPIGGHHLGGTRMSQSTREGVVDEQCRVHGTNNLYVASASVFPTSSHANPTLTIIALSLRLADYLRNSVGSKQ